MHTILFITADGEKTLFLEEEQHRIEQALGITGSPPSDTTAIEDKSPADDNAPTPILTAVSNFQLITISRSNASAASVAFAKHTPTIVHFAGHGLPAGSLLEKSASSQSTLSSQSQTDKPPRLLDHASLLQPDALAGVLASCHPKVEVVLLNACYSDTLAEACLPHVEYVIGMKDEVPDDTALAFTEGFYAGLQAGLDHRKAYKAAINTIRLQGLIGDDIPCLRSRDETLEQAQQLKTKLWNLPEPTVNFTGRESELAALAAPLDPRQGKRSLIQQAIVGLGGMGKSQLATQHATLHRYEYNLIHWLSAERATDLNNAFRILLKDHFGESDEDFLKKAPASKLAKRLYELLKLYPRVLLIFDNATEYQILKDYLPKTEHDHLCHIIITSRNHAWGKKRKRIKLDALSLSEAETYLLTSVEVEAEEGDRESAQTLSQMMGCLPLALNQAMAYMNVNDLRITHYLSRYQAQARALLESAPDAGEYHEDSVAVTLSLSIEKLSIAAKKMLVLGAWLAPDTQPKTLLIQATCTSLPDLKDEQTEVQAAEKTATPPSDTKANTADSLLLSSQGASSSHPLAASVATVISNISEPSISLDEAEDAWGECCRYSLLSKQADGASEVSLGRMHRLLQQVLQDQQTDPRRCWQQWQHLATLFKQITFAETHPASYTPFLSRLPSLEQLYQHVVVKETTSPLIDDQFTAQDNILDSLQVSYFYAGNAGAQLAMAEKLLAHREQYYGPTHIGVANTLNNLALARNALGDATAAKALFERALVICEAYYGPTHVNVATTLNNLALAHRALGDATATKALFERALAINEAYYGPTHVKVATTLNNLALAHRALGDATAAKVLFERALAIEEAYYGPTHVKVATTLNNLANAHSALGDATAAKALSERALTIKEAYYGPTHVEVATTINDLANAHRALGDATAAKALFERALSIKEAYYGPTHVEVATTINGLATVHRALGDATAAKALCERALAIDEAYYGPTHVAVATTLNNLATAHRDLGDITAAKALFERTLAIDEAYYGPTHVEVATTLHNLATVHLDLGDATAAKALYERALSIKEAYYGPTHVAVGRTLYYLAQLHRTQGEMEDCKSNATRAVSIFKAHPEHSQSQAWSKEMEQLLSVNPGEVPSTLFGNSESVPSPVPTEAVEKPKV